MGSTDQATIRNPVTRLTEEDHRAGLLVADLALRAIHREDPSTPEQLGMKLAVELTRDILPIIGLIEAEPLTCVACGKPARLGGKGMCHTCLEATYRKSARKPAPVVTCGDCGEEKPHYGNGRCAACNQRRRRAARQEASNG